MGNQVVNDQKNEGLSKGLGVAGLVIGIVTLLISFIPCVGSLAMFFGSIGIAVSVGGLVIALQYNYEKGIIIAGLVCSLLGTAMGYYKYKTFGDGIEEFKEEIEEGIERASKAQEDANELKKETEEEIKEIEEEIKKQEEEIKESIEEVKKEIEEEIKENTK